MEVGIPHQRMSLRIGHRDEEQAELTGTRSILTTVDEYRAAVAEIATRAQRCLAIYTPDLEPQLYDHDHFLEPMKRLVLARSHARVAGADLRSGPRRARGQPFPADGAAAHELSRPAQRRRPSSAATRAPSSSPTTRRSPTASRPRAGTASSSSTTSTSCERYMTYFDEVWVGSVIQPELRATAIDF